MNAFLRAAFSIFWFEFRGRLKSPALWITFAVLAYFGYQNVNSTFWDSLLGSGRVARNSPYAAYFSSSFSGFYAILLGAGFAAAPILRDVSTRTARIAFALPVPNSAYLLGKWLAAVLTLFLVLNGITAGFIIAPYLAGSLGQTGYMATPWLHLAHAILLFILPSALIFGTIHFCLAALSGRQSPCFGAATIGLLTFIVVYSSVETGAFDGAGSSAVWMRVLEPTGFASITQVTDFWTPNERNSRFLSVNSEVGWHTLLWCIFSALMLALTALRFNPRGWLSKSSKRRRFAWRKQTPGASANVKNEKRGEIIVPTPDYRVLAWARFALRDGWRNFYLVTRETPFRLLFAFLLIYINRHSGNSEGIVPPEGVMLPVTFEALMRGFTVFIVPGTLALLYFCGDLINRDVSARTDKFIGSAPVPDAAIIGAKWIGVTLLALCFGLIPVLAFLPLAFLSGFAPNWDLLVQISLINVGPSLVAWAWLALAIHLLVRHKALGNALCVIAVILMIVLNESGAVENRLWLFGMPSSSLLSDFDVQAQTRLRQAWFAIFWLALASVAILLARSLYSRGTENTLRHRVRQMPRRFSLARTLILGAAALGALWTGNAIARIIHDNGFAPRDTRQSEAALYEKTWGEAHDEAQPQIAQAHITVDAQPEQRRAQVQTRYTLENRTARPIARLHLEWPENTKPPQVTIGDQSPHLERDDQRLRHRVYRLSPPLQPGARIELKAQQQWAFHGFANNGLHGPMTKGATFFGVEMLPTIGYNEERELHLHGVRRQFGLGEHHHRPSASEAANVPFVVGSDDATRVRVLTKLRFPSHFEIAAPGVLQKKTAQGKHTEWIYEGEITGWNWRFCAAPYKIHRDTWTSPAGNKVAIEIKYLPRHEVNIQRMTEAVKFALAQLTRNLGEYPHRLVRIAEAPDGFEVKPDTGEVGHSHASAGSSISGNTIFLPEKQGWVHDYQPEPYYARGAMDWITYVTARDLSRAYWGQSVAVADTRGSDLLTEALPAFYGMRVLETRRGKAPADAWMNALRERYFKSSALEDETEPSLIEGDEEEYHLQKGVLAFQALREMAGAARFDDAIRRFVQAHRNTTKPPFANALDLRDAILKVIPQSHQKLAREWLDDVVVYDFKIVSPRKNNNNVEFSVETEKWQARDNDNRHATKTENVPVEIAAFDKNKKPIKSATRVLSSAQSSQVFKDTSGITRLEIDPRRLYLDRAVQDNSAPVR